MKALTAAAMLHALYGNTPVALIKDFQDKGGLVVTGELDRATIRELRQSMIWLRYGGPAPLPRKHNGQAHRRHPQRAAR